MQGLPWSGPRALVMLAALAGCGAGARGQLLNRAPHFTPGSGDMSLFTLSESTPVGTPVYQLKGEDPEYTKLHYSISGQYFTVDRDTGVVTLAKPLDREKDDVLEVIISITDESIGNSEPNTISLRREIPILDFNDNPPVFRGRPYSARISESAEVGTELEIVPEIIVTDKDGGVNSDVDVVCYSRDNLGDAEACDVFRISTEKLAEGQFSVRVHLKRSLDFESRSSFRLGMRAQDGAEDALFAMAAVSVDVLDVQDQPPIFGNAPYSATVPENTPEGTFVMNIAAKDGDSGNPRPILITLENDHLGYFDLVTNKTAGEATLVTTSSLLDRENPSILQNGGVYSFFVKATELINNEIPSDYSVTQVTIVITDTDDHKPTFNQEQFDVSIPENIKAGTPIPGLSVYVEDNDLSFNSRYNLTLRNVNNAENVYTVSPTYGEGRTPLAIKVQDASKLDYDIEDTDKRSMSFDIVALVNGEEVTSTRVNIKLLDTNDNSPIFNEESYKVNVLEDADVDFKISDLKATDKDSGTFGRLEYVLTGFGSEYFKTDRDEGGLFVNIPLDYEKQKSYSLTMVAKDGGGKVSTVNVFAEVEDVNDNAPAFEEPEYSRTIRDGATTFEPQLVVRATDRDGPQQGGNSVIYTLISDNSISNSGNVFSIDDMTGEIKINDRVDSMDTPRGQYELVIRATDKGYPPLNNDTRVYIRVGVPGNQRPIFKGNYNSFSPPKSNNDHSNSLDFSSLEFGPMNYKASVQENALFGSNVTTVSANDPDGLDYLLTYHIVGGAKDNFIINEMSGLITVSPDANLDRDTNPDHYDVIVTAVDSGTPVPETATTTVFVTIQDVNDKPPKFNMSSISAYVSERAKIGKPVVKLTATDTDVDSDLIYSIIDPIKAFSKSGVQLKFPAPYNYKTAFRIDEKTGEIFVNSTLDYNLASIVILSIKAEDLNAVYNKDKQFAIVELTLYIQSFNDNTPQFTNDGWTSTNQKILVNIKEEEPVGSTLFVLTAEDPISGHIVSNFKVINSETDLMQVDPQTGQVLLTKRLDYEALESPDLTFTVKATSNDGSKYNTAVVTVRIQNINDNAPEFKLKTFKTSVTESSKYPERILTVEATDMDAVLNEKDKTLGYSEIRYSLSGQNSNLFIIDNKTGVIQIAPNKSLDRERQSVLRVDVVAADTPADASTAQQVTAALIVDVLDVNDNAPSFGRSSYMAVVPENVNIGQSVINITATDPDEGLGGEIKYEFIDEGDANGLFQINSLTGEVRTRKQLAGKGRAGAYALRVRAADGGALAADAALALYVGDVSANDGVPLIIQPALEQPAMVSENATVGSTVFQVVASDPDDPSQPSGQLTYRLQEASPDALSFYIDPSSGLITTRKPLDREKKASYELILVVSDRGDPPQSVTRVLQVNVIDVDDHKPRFIRAVDDPPIVFSLNEELPEGTLVGEISAVDEDIGDNGAIDYMFITGNELGLFKLSRSDDNKAVIKTAGRLDRESASRHLLAVRCFKKGSHSAPKPYNRLDPSEVQVLIQVLDVDDHLPEFPAGNVSLGVRLNAPAGTPLLRVSARDLDSDARPLRYSLAAAVFRSPVLLGGAHNATALFTIEPVTGELSSTKSLVHFADGTFSLTVRANNSKDANRYTEVFIQMFIVRDRDLLRFIFRAPPSEVRRNMPEFSGELSALLAAEGLEIHLFDAQVLSESDNTLDFSSTSSCFQLTQGARALGPGEMRAALERLGGLAGAAGARLGIAYERWRVGGVLPCAKPAPRTRATAPHLWLLALAALLVLAALVAACSVCCLHSKYKRQSKRFLLSRAAPPPGSSMGVPRIYSEPYYST